MNYDRPRPDCPLVVAYGIGVNSTAMLIEFVNRDIRPDMILFADTGGEKRETYAYMPVIQRYLRTMGFPLVKTVRYEPVRAVYRTLEGQCLHTKTLPSLAYGGKTCSLKYKRAPQDKEILKHYSPHETIRQGRRVVRAIGFDASESRRTYAGVVLCGWLHKTTYVGQAVMWRFCALAVTFLAFSSFLDHIRNRW